MLVRTQLILACIAVASTAAIAEGPPTKPENVDNRENGCGPPDAYTVGD